MTETEHPFVVGARVAVHEEYGDGVKEAFVDKVYKTGRFVLRGSKQQWSPWRNNYGDKNWSASSTGGSVWRRRRLDLWDENTDKEISEKLEASKARARWRELSNKVHQLKNPTNALCDVVEAALTTFSRG